MTTSVSQWVKNVMARHEPSEQTLEFVRSFSAEFHDLAEKERELSTGLHDIDAIEFTYQHTLEACAAILLAGNETNDPAEILLQYHASQAGGDDHFKPWGRLLTGLDCDPPIIVQFPFYLLMCNSFTLEPQTHREDYVYATLTGVDWVRLTCSLSTLLYFLHDHTSHLALVIGGCGLWRGQVNSKFC
jgi:hypothetical protein